MRPLALLALALALAILARHIRELLALRRVWAEADDEDTDWLSATDDPRLMEAHWR